MCHGDSRETDDVIAEILDHETIAVVGCSSTPGKAAHEVPDYLLSQGYDVIPVNPTADEIFGRVAHDTLSEVEATVDVVDVFRPSPEVAGIVDETLDREDVQAIWLQQGIRDDEAADRARSRGLSVVQDRCIKVEHRRRSSA